MLFVSLYTQMQSNFGISIASFLFFFLVYKLATQHVSLKYQLPLQNLYSF